MLAAIIAAIVAVPIGYLADMVAARLALDPYEAAPEAKDDGEAGEARLRPAPVDDEGADAEAAAIVSDEQLPYWLAAGARARRVMVIAATVALFVACALRYDDEPWQVVVTCAYAAILVVCTVTDLLAHRIANVVTYPSIILALIVGLVAPGADASEVLIGLGVCFGALFVPVVLGGSSLGDVKLGIFMGAALGMPFSFHALIVMALAGGVGAAGVLIASRLRARRAWIPYGPYIAAGFVFVMLLEGTAFRAF